MALTLTLSYAMRQLQLLEKEMKIIGKSKIPLSAQFYIKFKDLFLFCGFMASNDKIAPPSLTIKPPWRIVTVYNTINYLPTDILVEI